jgi:phosphatidylserine/phosphatidylglycerophosphate/cardiolipin synthase-like enzyme
MKDSNGEGIENVLIQPDSGIAPVTGLIGDAKSSIQIKQFTLDEPRIVDSLIAAHDRGVLVRVLLNPQRPSGLKSNEDIFRKFADHKIPVKWTSPKFAVTHEKSLLVDRATALISTFNMSLKYFTETRDFGVILKNPALVSEIGRCFDADWDEKDFIPDPALPLIWSTTNSRKKIAGFIDRARSTLDIQHPKLTDITVLDRLLDAQNRGVKIRFLCGGAHGIQPWDICDTFSSWHALARAGVTIHRMKHLKAACQTPNRG